MFVIVTNLGLLEIRLSQKKVSVDIWIKLLVTMVDIFEVLNHYDHQVKKIVDSFCRCNFHAYCLFSLVNTVVYCIPAGWLWGKHGFLYHLGGTLDFDLETMLTVRLKECTSSVSQK